MYTFFDNYFLLKNYRSSETYFPLDYFFLEKIPDSFMTKFQGTHKLEQFEQYCNGHLKFACSRIGLNVPISKSSNHAKK